MPVKKLPRSLVKRLRKAGKKIDTRLGKMKNVDHRKDWTFLNQYQNTNTTAGVHRVRQMNIARNYPNVKLVIKRVHGGTAKQTIRKLRRKVQLHNSQYQPKNYILLAPIAYVIGKDLVAMSKTNCPSVDEITGELNMATARGTAFFEQRQEPPVIDRWHEWFLTLGIPLTYHRLQTGGIPLIKKEHGVTMGQLWQAANLVYTRTDILESNLLLLNVKNRKFIFMPLVDLE